MKIHVIAKTGAPSARVEQKNVQGKNTYIVFTPARPQNGKANAAICRILADFFHVPSSCVGVRGGFSSKNKTIEITGL